jgi:diguanylate cyclase (GGDEF)-like protein
MDAMPASYHDIPQDGLPGGALAGGGQEDGAAALSVLVVDDEVWIAEELAIGLKEAGMRVQTAVSAIQARAALAACNDIGVVVTDIRMPGEDGLSLVRRAVMNRPPLRAVETVVMTGHATVDDAVAAVRAGAFDFVRKPFPLDEIIGVVGDALARAAEKRRAARSGFGLAPAVGTVQDEAHGVADRAAFVARLRAAAEAEPEALRDAAVIALDLDHFGALNDAAGSAAGDAVLAEVAARMRRQLGPDWFLARLGADDFAAFARDAGGAEGLAAAAERLRAALERPFLVQGESFAVTASMGTAHGSVAGGGRLDDAALLAMGAARRAGGARVTAFVPALRTTAERRLAILKALRQATDLGQMELHYQPIFRAADRRLIGFEALLRWRHPELGPISPAEFIPLAEDGPAILTIGAWVIEAAARQAAAWRRLGPAAPYIAVNVSGRQVAETDVPGRFATALAAHGLPAEALVAEITETVAAGPAAGAVVAALQAQGIRVALDDFGMGYSSLGVLGSLRVNTVKLDRSLLSGIERPGRERQLFAGLATTIRALGLSIVAEGVETEEQFRAVAEAGCQATQGYLLGAPLRAAAAEALVVAEAARASDTAPASPTRAE